MTRLLVASCLFVAASAAAFACGTTADPISTFDPEVDAGVDAPNPFPEDASFATSDGSDDQPPLGSPERACYDNGSLSDCRSCCDDLEPDGREVFNDAVEQCICQPSQCGADNVCGKTVCGAGGVGTACRNCIQEVTGVAADASANPSLDTKPDGGDAGRYPELGIENCPAWSSAKCRADEGCRKNDRCRDWCRSKDRSDGGTDAG